MRKAEAGDIDGGEDIIVGYYDYETVRFRLGQMRAIKAFVPRMRLAQMALEDYGEGRYHACIPVVLALMDGMVTELHEKRRGFFADEADFEAWNSVAAHNKGLNVLATILRKGRYRTMVESIRIPYRNGIMHGMDLGYDNKMVAAKTWAALFATADWALRAEQGLLHPPSIKPSQGWRDLFRQIRENEDERKRLDAWRPRNVRPGHEVAVTGSPEDFGEATPERRLAEYLMYWRVRNYGYMAKCVCKTPFYPSNILPARIRNEYSQKQLISFEIIVIADQAPAISEIHVKLRYREESREIENLIQLRLLYENVNGQAICRGTPGGEWFLMTWDLV